MLKLYNKEHVAIAALTNLNDYKIEYLLSGEDLLEFSLSICDENIHLIEEEGYVRNKNNEYIIKAIDPAQEFKRYSCVVNIESIKGKSIANFDTSNNTITDTIRLAIAGTGWILADNNITKRRTVRLKNTNALEVLREVRKVFRVDFRFDAINKTIHAYEEFGEDKGVYFSDELNLKSFSIPSDTYDYATRLYCYGKDGLTIATVNSGKEYIENFQYTNKVIEVIWEDGRYTDSNSLKADAEAKLEELSKPKRSYQATITDLAKQSEEYKFLDFFLGDTITLLSKSEKFRDKQRIVKYIEYPNDPNKNTCELGNTTLTFEELQKENEYKNQVVNNITSDNNTVDGSKVDSITTEQISDFKASVAEITDLTVVNAEITNLKAQNVTITGKLNAIEGEFGTIKANVGVIDKLTVTHTAQINALEANKASITQLEAVSATIGTLEATVGKIETLVNGNLSSENIQAGGITSDKLTISNGFIKNAMIDSLDVSKINAGTITTEKFKIKSNDGSMEFIGSTQQFKDKNNKVRIQLGKDAQGNFNFIIRGEDGTTTLIDHTGVKAKAIANDLIVSDMIAGDAVGEKQINYSSFATGFNKDTNTSTIKSSKVNIDLLNQTLDIAFNSLKTQADGTKSLTESHSTIISTMQGEIKTAINNTQIVKDGQTILLKDDYNRTVSTVNSMNSTIGSHTTKINEHTGKITGVETRVNTVERDLNSITQRVSSTETNVTTITTTANSALANANSALANANSANSKIDNLQVGGRNLLKNTSYKNDISGTNNRGTYHIISRDTTNVYNNNNSLKVVCNTVSISGQQDIWQYLHDIIIVGKNLIASFYIKGTVNTTGWIRLAGANASGGMKTFNITTSWNLIVLDLGKTSSAGTKGAVELIYGFNAIGTYYINSMQLEYGTKVSEWSQAPEDVQTQIDANKTEISTTKNKVSTIETNLSNITSRVSTVESKQTTVDGKVTALETWKKSAEQKITDASIISTVSSQFYKKGETDGKYATQAALSTLTQTVNGFEFKITQTGTPQLIKNGDLKNEKKYWYSYDSTITKEAIGSLHVAPTATSGTVNFGVKTPAIDVQNGVTYTCAFLISSNKINSLNYCWLVNGNTRLQQISNVSFSQNGNYYRCTITFTSKVTNNVFIMLGYQGSYSSGMYFRIKEMCCYEGTVAFPYRKHDSEIYSGITYIDAEGISVKHSDGSYSKLTAEQMEFTNVDGKKKMTLRQGGMYTHDTLDGGMLGYYSSGRINGTYRGMMTGLTGHSHFYAIGATTGNQNKENIEMTPYIYIAQLPHNNIPAGINFMNTYSIFHQPAVFKASPLVNVGLDFDKDHTMAGHPSQIFGSKDTLQVYGADTLILGVRYGGLSGYYFPAITIQENTRSIEVKWAINMNGNALNKSTIVSSEFGYEAINNIEMYRNFSYVNVDNILDKINIVVPPTTLKSNINRSLEIDITDLKNSLNSDLFIKKYTIEKDDGSVEEVENIDMKSMLHLALLEIKKLKEEVRVLRAS